MVDTEGSEMLRKYERADNVASIRLMNLQHKLVELLGLEDDTDVCYWNIRPGSWECADSPIGVCVYNSYTDPALDGCLICHEPHERK